MRLEDLEFTEEMLTESYRQYTLNFTTYNPAVSINEFLSENDPPGIYRKTTKSGSCALLKYGVDITVEGDYQNEDFIFTNRLTGCLFLAYKDTRSNTIKLVHSNVVRNSVNVPCFTINPAGPGSVTIYAERNVRETIVSALPLSDLYCCCCPELTTIVNHPISNIFQYDYNLNCSVFGIKTENRLKFIQIKEITGDKALTTERSIQLSSKKCLLL